MSEATSCSRSCSCFEAVIAPEASRLSSRSRRARTCSISFSNFSLLAREVGHLGLGAHDVVAQGVDEPVEARHLGELGQRPAAVAQPVERAVEALQLQQPELDERVGLHAGELLAACVQGSVTVSETTVSTVVAADSRRAASASHGCSVAQCAASSSASPSGASLAGWWRRSAVR